MRRLLTPLLLTLLSGGLLSGCVTHYYPAYEEPPQARYSANVVYGSGDVAASVAVRYYPWWSLDYLYLGYGYGYGYPRSGLSVGFSWGFGGYYSPWYSPWYDRYRFSAWYAPVWYAPAWYGPTYGWHDPYWHHRYHRHYRHHPRGGHPRYVHDGYRPPRHGHGAWDGVDSAIYDRDRMVGKRGPGRGGARTPDTGRYVSVVGGDGPGQRGMEVRSPVDRKAGRSRTGPVETRAPNASLETVNRGGGASPAIARRDGGSEVRSRGDRKPSTPRTTPPVARSDAGVGFRPATRIEPATWSSDGNRTVRSRADRKVTPSRTQPTRRVTAPSSRQPIAPAPVTRSRDVRSAPVKRERMAGRPVSTAPVPSARSAPGYDAPRANRGAVSAPPPVATAPRSAPPVRVSAPPRSSSPRSAPPPRASTPLPAPAPRSSPPRTAPPPAASPPPRRSVSAPPPRSTRSAPPPEVRAGRARGGERRR